MRKDNGDGRGLDLGGEHTAQYTDDVLENHTPETCIILFTDAPPHNSIKIKNKKLSIKKLLNFY